MSVGANSDGVASDLLDRLMADPWDPFDGRCAGVEPTAFPRRRLRDAKMPIGAFIIGALVLQRPNRTTIRGLRLVDEFFRDYPLSELVALDVEFVEAEIRGRAVQRARERLAMAEAQPDSREKTLQVARARVSLSRNGFSQWSTFLNSISWLMNFALKCGVLESELRYVRSESLHGRAPRSRLRHALTEDQMHLIWDAARTGADPELATLVLDFIRETAARRQAVIDLTLDDINWAESTLTLHTKFDTTVELPISEDLLVRIAIRNAMLGWDGQTEALYEEWRPNPSRAAFRRLTGKPLTAKYFERVFDKVDRNVGEKLEVRVSAHWLRHTTLSQVEQIAGLGVAGQWAGHKFEGYGRRAGNATLQYTQWTMPQLKELHRLMFPDTPPGGIDPRLFCDKFAWMQANQGV